MTPAKYYTTEYSGGIPATNVSSKNDARSVCSVCNKIYKISKILVQSGTCPPYLFHMINNRFLRKHCSNDDNVACSLLQCDC